MVLKFCFHVEENAFESDNVFIKSVLTPEDAWKIWQEKRVFGLKWIKWLLNMYRLENTDFAI